MKKIFHIPSQQQVDLEKKKQPRKPRKVPKKTKKKDWNSSINIY